MNLDNLIEGLRTHGEAQRGTDAGGLMQWAMLHISSTRDANETARSYINELETERGEMFNALLTALEHTDAARETLRDAIANVRASDNVIEQRDGTSFRNIMATMYGLDPIGAPLKTKKRKVAA